MSNDLRRLDPDIIRELFDLRSTANLISGGGYHGDPYPQWHELRESGPIHEGTVHELIGFEGPAVFQGLPMDQSPHYSAFSFAACDEAFRDGSTFSSAVVMPDGVERVDPPNPLEGTLLCMNGAEHRRNRALVQPSFSPARIRWWMENWTNEVVHGLIDNLLQKGRGDLNVDFFAAIPLLTITGSFGIAIGEALDLRRAIVSPDRAQGGAAFRRLVAPAIEARRTQPSDDLISVLVGAELTEEDGTTHRLSNEEIFEFAMLILAAGSGTTWKQMGITAAALLSRPALLEAVRTDRQLLKQAVDESVRWMPTDPMFARWVTRDVDFHGHRMPKGSILHLCVAAASRDPQRWDAPDEFDPLRPPLPSLGFGGGAHTCLGMHVARAEILTALGALLDRLPNLRLDPDADPPRFTGMYERGATEIQVVFG